TLETKLCAGIIGHSASNGTKLAFVRPQEVVVTDTRKWFFLNNFRPDGPRSLSFVSFKCVSAWVPELWVGGPGWTTFSFVVICGNRTPVSRVTGGDTHHYTKEEEAATSQESFLHFVKCPTHVRQHHPLPSPRECRLRHF